MTGRSCAESHRGLCRSLGAGSQLAGYTNKINKKQICLNLYIGIKTIHNYSNICFLLFLVASFEGASSFVGSAYYPWGLAFLSPQALGSLEAQCQLRWRTTPSSLAPPQDAMLLDHLPDSKLCCVATLSVRRLREVSKPPCCRSRSPGPSESTGPASRGPISNQDGCDTDDASPR